ncbi:unnamed protein product, partial [Mesorhabditis belari]|uniref:Uncharacterized protein n=1 Tax=Mesorhabditis belari TaxID=2138241 RepID=A0AAF3EXH3_9BILA
MSVSQNSFRFMIFILLFSTCFAYNEFAYSGKLPKPSTVPRNRRQLCGCTGCSCPTLGVVPIAPPVPPIRPPMLPSAPFLPALQTLPFPYRECVPPCIANCQTTCATTQCFELCPDLCQEQCYYQGGPIVGNSVIPPPPPTAIYPPAIPGPLPCGDCLPTCQQRCITNTCMQRCPSICANCIQSPAMPPPPPPPQPIASITKISCTQCIRSCRAGCETVSCFQRCPSVCTQCGGMGMAGMVGMGGMNGIAGMGGMGGMRGIAGPMSGAMFPPSVQISIEREYGPQGSMNIPGPIPGLSAATGNGAIPMTAGSFEFPITIACSSCPGLCAPQCGAGPQCNVCEATCRESCLPPPTIPLPPPEPCVNNCRASCMPSCVKTYTLTECETVCHETCVQTCSRSVYPCPTVPCGCYQGFTQCAGGCCRS